MLTRPFTRKHTGERPFQCHCQRRFSRLDNLRQHAQTVHVNEDIPYDSLAATGTRYQRQIRTDRVQRGGRARASTAGSVSGPARGHSKSLSTSSIASISSIGSSYSTRDDVRRRPPPLVMAADPNARLSIESYHSVGSAQFSSYRGASPSDYSTPTSANFSTGQSSPHWGSGIGSPATAYSRAIYPSGSRTPGRRLSVPTATGGNPFHSPHGATGHLGRPLFGSGSMNSSNGGALASPGGAYLASPTTSTASGWSRRDSVTSEEAWRRKTWHPDSSNFTPPGSRLSQVITSSQINPPHEPLPALNSNGHKQHQQTVRLPGIDSLLPKPGQQMSPPPGPPSPRTAEYERRSRVPLLPSASISDERRNMPQWEMGLHRGLTRLDINNTTPPRDGAGAWANEVHQAMQARVDQPQQAPRPQLTVRFDTQPQIVSRPAPPPHAMSSGHPRGHHHTMSAPLLPRGESKRHGWYNGPSTVHEDRVLEARPHVDRMAHPNLHAFTGFPNREESDRRMPDNADSRRFDALVAVATSEGSTATAC